MSELERLIALRRMARNRLVRRMGEYNRSHALVTEATKLSVRLGELIAEKEFNPFSPEFRRG